MGEQLIRKKIGSEDAPKRSDSRSRFFSNNSSILEEDEQVTDRHSLQPVLLIHGLGGNGFCMLPLKWGLNRRGLHCMSWNYASFRGSIESHGERLRRFVETELGNYPRVHFVAHSLGSIVVRAAFKPWPPHNVGRTVFLAPPNSGSPAAELARRIAGSRCQTLVDLSNHRESFVNRLPAWDGSELGIIAAQHDFVVPLHSTVLKNQSEHIVVPATHAGLLISKTAIRLTASFLKSGRFGATGEPA